MKMRLSIVGKRDVRWLLDLRVCFDDGPRKANLHGTDRTGLVGGCPSKLCLMLIKMQGTRNDSRSNCESLELLRHCERLKGTRLAELSLTVTPHGDG